MRRTMMLLLCVFPFTAPAQISNRPAAVEVVVPMPPTPVEAAGKRILAYELHITNFGIVPLVLRHIEVTGAGDPIDFSGDILTKMLRRFGDSEDNDPARLDVGRRLIAFLWLPLPLDAAIAPRLVHRLVFDIVPGDDQARQSVIDNIAVPVHAQVVPMLRPPLAPGEWLAGYGPSNTSDHRRTIIALGGRAWISQRFAIDFVHIGKNGNTFHDDRSRNENFWSFGLPVYAVADGEVTEVVDAYPDNPPGQMPPVTIDNIAGNRVIVRIGPDQYALFAHLQQHSIRVHLHDRVKRGDVIARVGNSGNATSAHLHFQLMNANSAIAAEGVPYAFDRFTFLGYGRDFEEDHHPTEPRHLEMPVDDEVIGIPDVR